MPTLEEALSIDVQRPFGKSQKAPNNGVEEEERYKVG